MKHLRAWSACDLAIVLLALALLALGGCAVGYPLKADGTPDTERPVIGVTPTDLSTSDAGKVGGLATLLTGNPAIGAGVTGIIGLIGAGWARSAGRHKGWEERQDAAEVQAPMPGTATASASTTPGNTTTTTQAASKPRKGKA